MEKPRAQARAKKIFWHTRFKAGYVVFVIFSLYLYNYTFGYGGEMDRFYCFSSLQSKFRLLEVEISYYAKAVANEAYQLLGITLP